MKSPPYGGVKRAVAILQAKRVKAFLDLKTYMKRSQRQRLERRRRTLQAKATPGYKLSKRLSGKAILPHGNYETRGAMHWR